MARKAPKQNAEPVVPQAQLDEIEKQRIAQKDAYEQEQRLIQQQSAEQTSAIQAMLNVYQRQAADLQSSRDAQAVEQQALLRAQEEQAKLIEAERVSEMAKTTNQQKAQTRTASRINRVISQRTAAKQSKQTGVFGGAASSQQSQIFSRRRDITPPSM